MPLQTKPYQERIPFWYPGSPQTAGRHRMSLMWPGKIDQAAYEQYLAAGHDHKDDDIRMDGPTTGRGWATACCWRSPPPTRRRGTSTGGGWRA